MTEIATIDWFERWGTSVFSENTAIVKISHSVSVRLLTAMLCMLKYLSVRLLTAKLCIVKISHSVRLLNCHALHIKISQCKFAQLPCFALLKYLTV